MVDLLILNFIYNIYSVLIKKLVIPEITLIIMV